MGSRAKFIKKIMSWGGKQRDLELVRQHAEQFTRDTETIEMLLLFYNLLANTNFLPPIAHEVLVLRQPTKQVAKKWGRKESGIHKIVWRQYNRIEKLVSENLTEIAKDPETNRSRIQYYHLLFLDLNHQHKALVNRHTASLFTFDIGQYMETDLQFNHEIGEEDFDLILQTLQMTSKAYLERLLEEVDKRYIGYLVHLIEGDKHNLSDRDLARKAYLQKFFALE